MLGLMTAFLYRNPLLPIVKNAENPFLGRKKLL
jgi:hypothetical protein